MREDLKKPPQCGLKFADVRSGNGGIVKAYPKFLGLGVRTQTGSRNSEIKLFTCQLN